MEINMADKDQKTQETIRYTNEDALKYLEDDDKTIELKAYIYEIYAVKLIKSEFSKKKLLKFIVTNGEQKLYILIWNELISQYEQEIRLNRILHIIGGYCRTSNHHNKDPNLLKVEIIVQPSTIVKFLGYHAMEKINIINESPIDVNISTIIQAVRLIRIKGHVKQCFISICNSRGSMTYGSGAIACDEYRIPVEISKYSTLSIDIGTCVVVTGTLIDNEGPLKIRCSDNEGIKVLENEPVMLEHNLEKAYRTIKRLAKKY